MRLRRAAVLVLVAAWALTLAPEALPARTRELEVFFLQDGRLAPVQRRTATIAGAVRALLSGPTASERSRGLSSAVPKETPLRGLAVERRIVTVDLGARFAAGRDDVSLRARIGQLVRTVGGIPGVRAVKILVEGGVPVGLFPGYDVRRPLTPAAVRDERGPTVRELQQLLVDLGFLGQDGATGVVDDRTAVAVLAFQKWAGLPRVGVLGPPTVRALERAIRPAPVRLAPGRRLEILLDRQLALLVDGGKVVRAVHISSGAGGRTPVGSFRVYRKERYSWSVPFEVWMPWASYFSGGFAMHEYPVVPAYPASHGCVRVNRYDAQVVYGFASYGTPVDVLPVST